MQNHPLTFSAIVWNLPTVPEFVGHPTSWRHNNGHDGPVPQICCRMRSNGQTQPQSGKQDILDRLGPAVGALCQIDGEIRQRSPIPRIQTAPSTEPSTEPEPKPDK